MAPVSEWRRLPPLALAYFAVKGIPQLVNMWPALVGIWAAGAAVRGFFWNYGIFLFLLAFVLAALLPYWYFKYRISGDHIQVNSGVFQRTRLTLYYDRVQQADIAQPFYFRPFGLAVLGLESAGSAQQEVDIPGLPLAEAETLKNQILALRKTAISGEESPAPEETATQPRTATQPDFQLNLPWYEVARYGLMNNGFIFLLPLLAPLSQRWHSQVELWLESLTESEYHQLITAQAGEQMAWLITAALVVLILVGILVVYAVSVAIALVRYWNYRLIRDGDHYLYQAGLLTLKTCGFRLHKLQVVTIAQGLVARCLQRSSITISKAGGVASSSEHDEQRFLIPVLNPDNSRVLLSQLGIPEPHWQRVHPFYMLRTGLMWIALYLLFVTVWILEARAPQWAWLLTLTPLWGLVAWRKWWCLGVFADEEWLAVRSGFIGWKKRWLPLVKIQKVAVTQPPWLRVLGLANLLVWSVDGVFTIPALPLERAHALRDHALSHVARHRGQWM
jgi:putative membrane protein